MSQPAEKIVGKPAVSLKDANFVWEDPLDIESDLTEDERMVRDSARGFAQDDLMPRILTAYREERYDADLFKNMGALGLLGPTIPVSLNFASTAVGAPSRTIHDLPATSVAASPVPLYQSRIAGNSWSVA